MKSLILIVMSVMSFQNIQSQTSNIEHELHNAILDLDSCANDNNKLLQLAAKFEEFTHVNDDNWLLFYYSSYCYVLAAFVQKSTDQIDPLAAKSELLLNKADSLSQDNSEISCIRSLIASARILVDPQSRGMKFGMLASQMLDRAKIQNADNPRAYFLEAQSLMYMPEEYGGGCKNAEPIIQIAKTKFENYVSESKTHPNWGYDGLIGLSKACE